MNRPIISFILILSFLTMAPGVLADQVTLKNGDRITGKVIKKDGEKITVETEAAGKIEIKWDAVAGIVTDETVHLELADGRKIAGPVRDSGSGLVVVTDEGEEVSIREQDIAVIRNSAQQAAYESQIVARAEEGFLDRWTGTADLGFSLTTGNSKTRSLNFGSRGERESESDKITLYIKGVQASNSTTGTAVTTAQAVWYGGRYDRYVNDKMFVFGKADFEYDKPQQLNLRAVAGGGFGYKLIRNDRTKLDIFGGATFNREYFEGADNRSSAEALGGEEFSFKFNGTTKLEQRLEVFPSLSRPGTVRARFDASLVTALNSWLGWHVSLGDRFNSDPVPGKVQNDLLFSTGLRATFGKKKSK